MSPASAEPTKGDVVEKFRIDTITAAALRAIGKKGTTVTVQDVADEAKIAKGTVYLYFKDRDELLQHVNGCAINELTSRVESILDQQKSGARIDEILPELTEAKLRFFDERRDFYRVHFELRFPEGPNQLARKKGDPADVHKERYRARLRDLFAGAGVAAEDASRVALIYFESVVAVILRRLLETPPPPAKADAQVLTQLFLYGLKGKQKK